MHGLALEVEVEARGNYGIGVNMKPPAEQRKQKRIIMQGHTSTLVWVRTGGGYDTSVWGGGGEWVLNSVQYAKSFLCPFPA